MKSAAIYQNNTNQRINFASEDILEIGMRRHRRKKSLRNVQYTRVPTTASSEEIVPEAPSVLLEEPSTLFRCFKMCCLFFTCILFLFPVLVIQRIYAHTAPYFHSTPIIDKDWHPDFRIAVTLTTLPKHLDRLTEVLDSLHRQTLPPDVIYLNVPKGISKRTGKEYVLDNNVTDQLEKHYKLIKILRVIDYGPATKLIPAIDEESDPNTLLITADDDFIYHEETVRHIAWYSYHHPDVAWSTCGWGFQWIPFHKVGVVPVYTYWPFRGKNGRRADVLQACCGIGYRRSFFTDVEALKNPEKECFTTDDIWISGNLERNNIDRALIPSAVQDGKYGILGQPPAEPQWKLKELASKDFDYNTRLSTINSKNMQDIKCIRAVEKRFGIHWKGVASKEP